MFRRIPWDDVLADLRVAGLLLLVVGSVILVARLLRMRREETERLSHLPLED